MGISCSRFRDPAAERLIEGKTKLLRLACNHVGMFQANPIGDILKAGDIQLWG